MLDGNDIETCPESKDPSTGSPLPRIVVHPPSANEDMGNGSSQSIVLGPPRLQSSSYPIQRNGNGYNGNHPSSVPKYVHPQNRVLPKPVVNGQPPRLRSTDNGSILQAAGTIRGAGGHRGSDYDPDIVFESNHNRDIGFGSNHNNGFGSNQNRENGFGPNHNRYSNGSNQHRGSHGGEKENERYMNLRNHRLFHSDPNIARRPMGVESSPVEGGYSNRRGCSNGGAAGRASKLKYKKKTRAPEPPGSGNSLPRDLERSQFDRRINNNCKCIPANKTRAPQPPAIVVHPPPPPPPPMPDTVTTRTTTGAKSPPRSELSSVTRAVECRDSRTNYEKNVHPLEKWRNCRSTGDVRMDEEQQDESSRTTVFDSRKVPDSQNNNKSYLPQVPRPDPFQKEIQMVTKKIAENRQTVQHPQEKSRQTVQQPISPEKSSPQKPSSPPKFYFSDPSVFKAAEPPIVAKLKDTPPDRRVLEDSKHKPEPSKGRKAPEVTRGRGHQDQTTIDEVVPSLQRFSPGRQRYKPPSRNVTPTPKQKAEKDWEDLSKSLYQKHEEDDPKIDIRLRPVLPRKTPDTPKFSPSEAWQALGSDGLSNPSTSDDGRDLTPRRYSDMDYHRHRNHREFKPRSLSDSHWTPRQDLSDVSSDDDAIVSPRGEQVVIPTRFSLPTVMFSNMRPIGTEVKAKCTLPEAKGGKKKNKAVAQANGRFDDHHHQQPPGFRRFLSRRSKYQSEEDVAVSDSNWTFGQYGLQKRGKQYSSELMLSDRKKYELMAKNDIGDFLGDILASKSDHLRDQMKSSDSGNSNFSFYSTDGQVLYKGREECSPPTKGRVYDMRRRFDANFNAESSNNKKTSVTTKKSKKAVVDADLGRRRDLELAKMLEDEVRKRRNKEKISIRQQLQRMKSNFRSDDDDEDFDDEAYFTEPKSRETQSPFFSSDLGQTSRRQQQRPPSRTMVDSARLSHWQSSPALLEDSMMQNGIHQPSAKGRLSLSSLMSSPDSGAWLPPNDVDHWLKQQQPPVIGRRLSEGDGGSSSPTPAPPAPKKERRKTNIYKQLMDIVRKEERQLKNAQRGGSGDSSSHRESSSETASTTSYSDSSESSPGGVLPANKEFGFRHSLQPYAPGKGYRPVPFDLPASHYRLPGLQEEGKHIPAEVS